MLTEQTMTILLIILIIIIIVYYSSDPQTAPITERNETEKKIIISELDSIDYDARVDYILSYYAYDYWLYDYYGILDYWPYYGGGSGTHHNRGIHRKHGGFNRGHRGFSRGSSGFSRGHGGFSRGSSGHGGGRHQ